MFNLNTAMASSFDSRGMEYQIIPNPTLRSLDNQGVYSGVKVMNQTLNIEGTIGDSIFINSKDEDVLSFSAPDLTAIHMVDGYWILKFPEGTDLLAKLDWVKSQPNVIDAEIEVLMELNQPR